MNRGEVRDFTRFLLDDKTGTLIADTDMNTLINVAIDKVATEILKLKEDYFVKTASLATVASTRQYAFSAVGSDVKEVRMVEKNTSPSYPKLRRLDWLKHKFEFSATGEPKHFFAINKTLYVLPVPDAVYTYTIYYDQSVTYPANDAAAVPLIPSEYHDIVGIWAALIAKEHLTHYQKQLDSAQMIVNMLSERKSDLAFELKGNRNEDMEIAAGILGSEAGARQ